MKKYKVIFEQRERFEVYVEAEDKQSADDLATIEFGNGNYKENGDLDVESISVIEIN